MRQKLSTVRIIPVVTLFFILAAESSAQVSEPASSEYARAIYTAIQARWKNYSYGSELRPSSSCAVRVTQMPGGDILSIDFFPDCDFNKAGRAAVIDAVRQSAPLPYHGFESAYQRKIRIVFHAASLDDRHALVVDEAATEQVEKDRAESDRKWQAKAGLPMLRDEYNQRCSFHLLWEMPKVKLQHPASLIVTVDNSGKVVTVASIKGEPVDKHLAAALGSTSPCDPVPGDLAVGNKTIKIGPIHVGNRSN